MAGRLLLHLLLLLLFSGCPDAKKAKPASQVDSDLIEDVSGKKLESLLETEEYLAVFFYTKICKNCDAILAELEHINDEAEKFGVAFVKNSDRPTAKKFGITKFPALAYFRNQEPTLYDGDLMDEEKVLDWLTNLEAMELADRIEEVNGKILGSLIKESQYLAVLFYKKKHKESEAVLQELENIDDEADALGIGFVKISETEVAEDFGLDQFPALVYYRKTIPLLYDGDLKNEEDVLKWLQEFMDTGEDADIIEEVSADDMTALIEKTEILAVFVYDERDEKSKKILEELEAIDDDADQHGIPFVKTDDIEFAKKYGWEKLPLLIYFENTVPTLFEGDLSNEDKVLSWLVEQKMKDEIEDVSEDVLDELVEKADYLAVLFYRKGDAKCEKVLKELENIDDELDTHDIPFVKIDDEDVIKEYGIDAVPQLVYFEDSIPNFYSGDLMKEEQVLEWLVKQKESDEIEDVTPEVLESLIKKSNYLAVLFYDKDDARSKEVLRELENIDDDADQHDLPFIKIDDDEVAKSYGIDDELPLLVYFEKEIPNIYEGDLTKEEEVIEWLLHQMKSDDIEEVSDKILDSLIEKHPHVAVLFYKENDKKSDKILLELENIDDEADDHEIVFLKTNDPEAAKKHGIETFPRLVFYDNEIPNLYDGDLMDEDKVLAWFIKQKESEEIEEITEQMLFDLVDENPFLVVLFYDKDDKASAEVLAELENIDDDLDKHQVPFVKIDDDSVAKDFGILDELPALVYFEDKIPNVYEGNLKNEEEVLKWILHQKAEDTIEEVTEEILEMLFRTKEYVLVFFAPDNCKECPKILAELEHIDDESDDHGIIIVTTDDTKLAKKQAGVTRLPAIVLFRNGQPVHYKGDLMDEDAILKWMTSEEVLDIPDQIERVNQKMLEKLLSTSDYVAVLFTKDKCAECDKVLAELENIDDEAEEMDIDFVKVTDPKIAKSYEIVSLPALVFFKKKFPQFYDGNLKDEDQVLKWLTESKERANDEIELVDRRMLEMLLEDMQNVAVFFFDDNCPECDKVLEELENIDDDTDKHGIYFVRIDDDAYAKELGVSEFPSLVYFENGTPSIYMGDLTKEEKVLDWLIQQKNEDTIENINREMLNKMITETDYLAVFFYLEDDDESQEILLHLENIDDDCSDYEVHLVKMQDNLMAKKYGFRNPPGIAYFRHGKHIKYTGDLFDEEEVLEWLTNPENMEMDDAIERVNKRMFERILAKSEYLTVFFYSKSGCKQCIKVLEELEKIDDDADAHGINMVKIDDTALAKKYGVFAIPAILFFHNEDKEPVIYAGDFKSGDHILEWILLQKNPGSEIIEEVEGDALKKLIKAAHYLAVLFYTEGPECEDCKNILNELENIDDDTDRHGIQFVKTTDVAMAQDYGVKDFPALVYFEKQIPNFYEGDLSAEEEVLQWLVVQKTEDTIETVNRDMLDHLIEETQYLAVFFYKPHCKACDQALHELENIDDDTDLYGIHMVKIQDPTLAKRYGIKTFPALVYFRNANPLIFDGDIKNEESVLEWLIDDDNRELADEIEAVNVRMLDKLVEDSPFLAVLFYEEECEDCEKALKELENIDDEADVFGIDFVKINDFEAAVQYGVTTFPTLVYFRKKTPVIYDGDLLNEEKVLAWLTSHENIELKDEIEEVNRKMLDKLLDENDFVAVFFYDSNCPKCDSVLEELENIDDEVDDLDVTFVKINDVKYARKYGIAQVPAIVYFRRKFPSIFRGDLTKEEEVLEWLKKNRYRHPELSLFMYALVAISAAFILYTLFLIFCMKTPREKKE
uniref:Putative thioredoxin/protein disulfide isomerase n=1 Tax=Ixodes ricinus TaxID=34613 RepID=A0A147BH45_IXORI